MGVLTHTKQACTASPKTCSAFQWETNTLKREQIFPLGFDM